MDYLRRVFTNVVNTIVPDSFRESRSTAARKRSVGYFEPELTDDEEVSSEARFSKRMRFNGNGPSMSSLSASRAIFNKHMAEAGTAGGRVIPFGLTNEHSEDDVIPVNESSVALNNRSRPYLTSRFPFRKNNMFVPRKEIARKKRITLAERFGKKFGGPTYDSFLQSVCLVRPLEKNQYEKLVEKSMTSHQTSSFARPAILGSANFYLKEGLNPPARRSSDTKAWEAELIDPVGKWSPRPSHLGLLCSTPIGAMSKVIDTIDISHESDSDDGVVCESPASPPMKTFTSSPQLRKSASAQKLELLGQRIKRVLETSLSDIEKHGSELDNNESLVNSGEKENDDEVEVLSPLTIKRQPVNSLAFDLSSSPFADETWLNKFKSSFAESQRERAEKIKLEETKMTILKNESTLDKDLAQIVRRNLTLTDIIVLEEPEEELKLPEITDEMRKVIFRARSPGGLGEVITTTANNIEITKSDIKSLAPMQWLNDNVINSYLDLIALRSKSHDNWPSVYVFTTFFYPKYLNEGYSNILKRWTRKVDLFSYDLLIFPIHLGIHWCLAAADNRKKIIKYYDSLGGKNYQCPKALLQYLGKEHQERKKSGLDNNWTTEIMEEIPQQQNGSDCGMFACKFAEYLSRDAELSFEQKDMNYYRERMIYEIITGNLLYP